MPHCKGCMHYEMKGAYASLQGVYASNGEGSMHHVEGRLCDFECLLCLYERSVCRHIGQNSTSTELVDQDFSSQISQRLVFWRSYLTAPSNPTSPPHNVSVSFTSQPHPIPPRLRTMYPLNFGYPSNPVICEAGLTAPLSSSHAPWGLPLLSPLLS